MKQSKRQQLILSEQMIFVTFAREGIHQFSQALTRESLASGDEYDVSFLGYAHRHMFHFRVGIEVFHDDREIEFIQFKRWLEKQYDQGTLSLNNQSCEMISTDLAKKIFQRYPGRKIKIIVSEDNENGAEMTFESQELPDSKNKTSKFKKLLGKKNS